MLLSVFLAAIAGFFFGWLWYSPLLFQKQWMELSGLPDEKPDAKTFATTMTGGLLSYVLLAFVMDILFEMLVLTSLQDALLVALLLWLGFVATLTLGSVTWEGKPLKLYFLHNAYHMISFLIIAAVLTAL